MKKILVVEDETILRDVLKESLEKKGYQVKAVASGYEGLELFKQFVPDLIVSDIGMPGMNGFEFCRELRSQPQGQIVPFIFLSAWNDLDSRVYGHSIGADDYLTKPFEMKELIAKIEGSIERSRRIHAEIVNLMQQFLANGSDRNTLLPSKHISSVLLPESLNSEEECMALPLTPAEERVFWEVIQGFTNKQISEHLFISPRTVQTHLSSILNKLNLENRTQLARFAYEKGYKK